MQMINIRNKNTDPTNIDGIIGECYKQLYGNKFDNLNKQISWKQYIKTDKEK